MTKFTFAFICAAMILATPALAAQSHRSGIAPSTTGLTYPHVIEIPPLWLSHPVSGSAKHTYSTATVLGEGFAWNGTNQVEPDESVRIGARVVPADVPW